MFTIDETSSTCFLSISIRFLNKADSTLVIFNYDS